MDDALRHRPADGDVALGTAANRTGFGFVLTATINLRRVEEPQVRPVFQNGSRLAQPFEFRGDQAAGIAQRRQRFQPLLWLDSGLPADQQNTHAVGDLAVILDRCARRPVAARPFAGKVAGQLRLPSQSATKL